MTKKTKVGKTNAIIKKQIYLGTLAAVRYKKKILFFAVEEAVKYYFAAILMLCTKRQT